MNPRHPAEARSSTAHTSFEAAVLAGQAADHLDPTAGLAEGAFDEVRVPHPGPVLTREPQVHRQRVAVDEQAPHRGRIGVAPTLFERVDPLLHVPDRVRTPGSILSGTSKIAQ